MQYFDILKCMDIGANAYLRIIGDAPHMEILDNGVYEMMRSRGDLNTLCSVYNIRLEKLSDEEMDKAIQEIRNLKVHTWWPLYTSERALDARNGKGVRGTFDDGEIYAAMSPEEKPDYPPTPNSVEVRRVSSMEEFETWCEIDNKWEHNGNIHIHPQGHFHLLESGRLRCYLGYVDGTAVTTAAIVTDSGIGLLGFTSTAPDYRQRGIAKSVCQFAIDDAFRGGAKVVCVSAIGHARPLAKSLGFDTEFLIGKVHTGY